MYIVESKLFLLNWDVHISPVYFMVAWLAPDVKLMVVNFVRSVIELM